jgi:hypothetical protein
MYDKLYLTELNQLEHVVSHTCSCFPFCPDLVLYNSNYVYISNVFATTTIASTCYGAVLTVS